MHVQRISVFEEAAISRDSLVQRVLPVALRANVDGLVIPVEFRVEDHYTCACHCCGSYVPEPV